jgi:hypothetical protein
VSHQCKDCVADEKAYDDWAAANAYGNGDDPGEPPVKPPMTVRPVVAKSGGRCRTHWRKVCQERRARAHEARVEKVYGLARGQYEKLYEAQGGRCYICQRATGKTRRLSVDHDHKTGYVRGLLCRPCNSLLGHIRDDVLVSKRITYYLQYPPAHLVLGKVKPENG